MGAFTGKYNRLIDIYRPTRVKSTTGQETESMVLFKSNIPCSYEGKSGNDTEENNQIVNYNVFVFKMHYPRSFDIRTTDEIQYMGERFKIDNLRESNRTGRIMELEITGTKKDNQ